MSRTYTQIPWTATQSVSIALNKTFNQCLLLLVSSYSSVTIIYCWMKKTSLFRFPVKCVFFGVCMIVGT